MFMCARGALGFGNRGRRMERRTIANESPPATALRRLVPGPGGRHSFLVASHPLEASMSPTPATIRMLAPDDLTLMEDLLTTFGEVFEDMEVHGGARPDAAYLQRLLGGDHFIALVALKEGRVVGGLAAYELQKFEQARSEIYIYDLAVAAAHRREGVATALIEALKPIAAARGACVIFVQADHGDDPAIALYSKLGK